MAYYLWFFHGLFNLINVNAHDSPKLSCTIFTNAKDFFPA
jgi:hypothetical protein